METAERVSRVDLHIHSKYSNRPSEWFLRKIGAPESFVEPLALYENCKRHGMDFVTISDHNTIDGALEIAHLPNTFISCEVTTYFPEDGCKIHFLVIGITEHWFKEIDALRGNIYDLREYVLKNNIIHSVAHPLFSINDKLTIDHFEKLLLLFNRFEGINGSRCHRACALANAVMEGLTPQMLSDMADKHGIEPAGPTPWKKMLTAGSDDHSGLYVTNAHTVTPYAATVVDFLEHIRAGRHEAHGGGGTSLRLAHSFYHIAYSYYAHRFLGKTSRDSSLIGAMLRKMAGEQGVAAEDNGFRSFMKRPLTRLTAGLKRRRLNDTERLILDEFSRLAKAEEESAGSGVPDTTVDQRNFRTASRISHQLTFSFLQKFVMEIKRGNLLESLQSISSLGPVVMGIAPYWTAFHTQHKDEKFLQELAAHYPATRPMVQKSGRKLWVTDTFTDVNGVARTLRHLASGAHARGIDITLATCLPTTPEAEFPIHNFEPVGRMNLPEYEAQEVVFPPFLDVLEFIEQGEFDEIILSTPGPLGLAARMAARLFGLKISGIYHTDFPGYIRHFTEDYIMEDLTRKYMAWFYGDMAAVYVSCKEYQQQLAEWGIPEDRLKYLPHGVDMERFNPSHRAPEFWPAVGVNGGFKFLYVGRVSKEKNLEALLNAFVSLLADGDDAMSAELIVVGEGPHHEELKTRFVQPQIVFTGFLEGEALSRAYAGADVFVFPSMTDTFGNVVLEAQASGLPAIVANRGGPQEIVTDGETGLVVDAGRPELLADAMRRLMRDEDLRARMARQAVERARTQSWEAALKDFLV